MARTKRVRVKIIEMLKQFGELDTATIYTKLNDTKSGFGLRQGCSSAALSNILGKEPVFVKSSSHHDENAARCLGNTGHTYKVSSWRLNDSLLEQYPELADYFTNSYLISGQPKKC